MIRTEPINYIPNFQWTEYSAFEFRTYSEAARKELIRGSRQIRIVYEDRKPLLIAGLFRGSLVAIPYLWTLLTEDFRTLRVSHFRSLIHELGQYSPIMETLIDPSNHSALRLAMLFKFRPTSTKVEVEGRLCYMFRRET